MSDLNSLSIEELKNKIQEKKASFALKTNVIDKFTNIDELLIETLKRLNALITEQEVTNKILIALYIQEGLDGSMVAKPIAGVDTSAILEGLRGDGGRTTIIHSIPNFSGNKKVFELTDSGFVIEIMFKSSTSTTDNKDYSVRIYADDTIIYQNTFTNFEIRNKFERDMTCYEDTEDSYYFLHFKNISYRNSFIVEIYESEATFEQIYLKYLEG